MSAYKRCPRCQTPAPVDAGFCTQCSHQYRTRFAGEPEPTQMFVEAPGRLRDQPQHPVPYRPQMPPVPQQPAYYQPDPYQQPFPIQEPRQQEQMALASFITGICSWFVLPPLTGTCAIVLGFVSLSKFERNPLLKGKWQAVTGIVLGLIGLTWWVAVTWFLTAILAAMNRGA